MVSRGNFSRDNSDFISVPLSLQSCAKQSEIIWREMQSVGVMVKRAATSVACLVFVTDFAFFLGLSCALLTTSLVYWQPSI